MSVQENFHVAETVELLTSPDTNILDLLSQAEQRVVRKRLIGAILATDMAKHTSEVSRLRSLVEAKGVSNGNNVQDLLDKTSSTSLFESQQFLIDVSLHSCDLGNPARPFEICKEWTYLLMDELWNQGDVEKRVGLPVSFLCDRNKVNVLQAQQSFIAGIILPLMDVVREVMPGMGYLADQARKNRDSWRELEEQQ